DHTPTPSHSISIHDSALPENNTPSLHDASSDLISYTLKVTNNGPSDNAGYTLKDVLAADTSFVSASSGCANAAGTVTCTSAGLKAGWGHVCTPTTQITCISAYARELAKTDSIDT